MAFAAVDEQDVGERFPVALQSPQSAADDFPHRREIVDAVDRADAVAFVAGFERQPVEELHDAGHRFAALQVRDVHTFNPSRPFGQFEDLLQAGHSFFGIDVEHFGLCVRFEVAAQIQVFERRNFIANAGRFFELQLLRRQPHLVSQFFQQPVFLAVEEHPQPANVFAVILFTDPQVAGSRALVDARQQTGPKPAPAFVLFVDVERAGAEAKNLLQHGDGAAEFLGVRERPVKFRSRTLRSAREFDARKIFRRRDFQIGERFVVLQFLIEARLNVLDQPGFQQQRVDFAVRFDVIDVGDFRDEVGRAAIGRGGFREITPGPAAQVHCFSDINHALPGVLHEIHARRRGKLANFLPRRERFGRRFR